MKMRSKRAAMEMTMGTLVTIVLLVAVLVVVLFFVSKIRDVGEEAIEGVSQAVIGEIDKIFSGDSSRKIVVIPATRKITIRKGDDTLGFGFSIRNTGGTEEAFSYQVSAVEASCGVDLTTADNYITLGGSRTGIRLPAGSFMEDPIFVRYGIPDAAPPCQIRYSIEVQNSAGLYGAPLDVDVEIKSA